jgi:hypothetical protein
MKYTINWVQGDDIYSKVYESYTEEDQLRKPRLNILTA